MDKEVERAICIGRQGIQEMIAATKVSQSTFVGPQECCNGIPLVPFQVPR